MSLLIRYCQYPTCRNIASFQVKQGVTEPFHDVCGFHLEIFKLMEIHEIEEIQWKDRKAERLGLPYSVIGVSHND